MPDNGYQAIDDTNQLGATECWYDRFHWGGAAVTRSQWSRSTST